MVPDIILIHNVKRITSGNIPTTDNLKPGELAFGLINVDGKHHIYGNSNGSVVDLTSDYLNSVINNYYDRGKIDLIVQALSESDFDAGIIL